MCDYSLRVQDLEHENMMQTQSIQSLTQEIEQMRLDNVKVIFFIKNVFFLFSQFLALRENQIPAKLPAKFKQQRLQQLSKYFQR